MCCSYVDEYKAFPFCGVVQQYYKSIQARTQVLPASLTSIDEVLMLAGVDHITVSPPLLAELAATPADSYKGQIGAVLKAAEGQEIPPAKLYEAVLEDESAWRLAFTRSERGKSEGKIIQAVNIFSEMQDGLEALVKSQEA